MAKSRAGKKRLLSEGKTPREIESVVPMLFPPIDGRKRSSVAIPKFCNSEGCFGSAMHSQRFDCFGPDFPMPVFLEKVPIAFPRVTLLDPLPVILWT